MVPIASVERKMHRRKKASKWKSVECIPFDGIFFRRLQSVPVLHYKIPTLCIIYNPTVYFWYACFFLKLIKTLKQEDKLVELPTNGEAEWRKCKANCISDVVAGARLEVERQNAQLNRPKRKCETKNSCDNGAKVRILWLAKFELGNSKTWKRNVILEIFLRSVRSNNASESLESLVRTVPFA